jgi:hypothetical protein
VAGSSGGGTLDKILTYHVVPGRLDSAALDKDIKNGVLNHNTIRGSVTFAGYREDDFVDARWRGWRGRISDGVMVLAAGWWPQDSGP